MEDSDAAASDLNPRSPRTPSLGGRPCAVEDEPGPANFRVVNAVLGCLREAGFSVENAVHAYSALDAYIYGFALQEKTLPVDTPAELAEAAESMRRRFAAAEYPHIAETITERVTRSGYDFADEFEFGLDMMLGALEQLRGTD